MQLKVAADGSHEYSRKTYDVVFSTLDMCALVHPSWLQLPGHGASFYL